MKCEKETTSNTEERYVFKHKCDACITSLDREKFENFRKEKEKLAQLEEKRRKEYEEYREQCRKEEKENRERRRLRELEEKQKIEDAIMRLSTLTPRELGELLYKQNCEIEKLRDELFELRSKIREHKHVLVGKDMYSDASKTESEASEESDSGYTSWG
jgi:hypothetical protein